MTHKPIQLKSLSFSFSTQSFFEDFTCQIEAGSRIGIIGRNGSGKSTLLNLLRGKLVPTSGSITFPSDLCVGFVPQVITNFDDYSGGERLNKALTQVLSRSPNLLLLDEPTNHLDRRNRKSLMRLLQNYLGSLIIVSHDPELLRHCVDTFWLLEHGVIEVFSGRYDDYLREKQLKRNAIEKKLLRLDREKKSMHDALMKEQSRAAKSRKKGEKSIKQKKWPSVVSKSKALRAEQTTGRKKSAIENNKQELSEQLAAMRLPEVIVPTFSMLVDERGSSQLLSIIEGAIGYDKPELLVDISLSIGRHDRVAILGDNGSGKSTLIKAIMGDQSVAIAGHWQRPKVESLGYLDQHYSTLMLNKSVVEIITELVPAWSQTEVRRHLSDFLFRKNEIVNSEVHKLSGGEKARLSLAQIACRAPRLLILDEVTNNLDRETREHVIQVLKAYPGALIVISHDDDFLNAIDIVERYQIQDNQLRRVLS